MKRRLPILAAMLFFCFLGACTRKSGERANQLRFPIESDPPTLDWSKVTDHVSIAVLFNLQEGLTRLDSTLTVQPALAEKWDISPDGKTYTFHIRDTKWSDGVPVRAQDFVYSWKRLLDPKTAAEYAYFLFDLEGAQDFNASKTTDFSKVGVKALNDKTLEVKLSHPASYFLNIPAFAVTHPHREDVITANPTDFTEPPHLRTTGAYRLTHWKHDSELFLEPNPYYYGPKPKIPKVYMRVVKEDSTALNLYERGELDVVLRLPSLELERVKKWPDYRSLPYLRGYYYGFNTQLKPFDNVLVRRAFSHAIDRSQITAILKGGKTPTSAWVPRGMMGYEPDAGLKYDPKKAKELLAKAGYPDGKNFPKVTLNYDSLEMHKLIAEKLQYLLKTTLGIENVELATQEWKVHLDLLAHATPQMWRLGWGADYPDPHNFLELFTSYSGNNHTKWKNPAYDKLIADGSKILDRGKRESIYHAAQKLLLEDEAVIIPLFQESHEMAVKPWVADFVIDAMEYPRISEASIQLQDAKLGE